MMTDSRTSQIILCVLSVLSALWTPSALVVHKSWIPRATTASIKARASSPITMYFDDVSRHHTVTWKPTGTELLTSSATPVSHKATATGTRQRVGDGSGKKEKKLDALQRMILGYDAESASRLSRNEISEQMKLWATKSGVVGDYFGDELYQDILGSSVCDGTSAVRCLAQFWETIASVIDDHTDEFFPHRWMSATAKKKKTVVRPGDQIHFVSFPNCPELYDYKTMFTFVAAMEFSKDLCLHLGRRFTLAVFHPRFKNSPKTLSPERHSPFPASGLEFCSTSGRPSPPREFRGMDEVSRHELSASGVPKRQRGNARFSKCSGGDEDDSDEDESDLARSRIRDLDMERMHLEVLFNSAAVSGSDEHSVASAREYDSVDGGSTTLTVSFEREHQMRRGRLPKTKVRDISEAWAKASRYSGGHPRKANNQALQFIDTVPEDRWMVSEHKIAEQVYADIWGLISDLYDIGVQADSDQDRQVPEHDDPSAAHPRKEESHGQHFEWTKTLSRAFFNNGNRGRDEKSKQEGRSHSHATPPVVVKSSMFVATKFCAFNAPSFKRFAITINAALKRLTDGRMFLEVFHPEYVGKRGYDHAKRRSPFPMIQICYEVKPVAGLERSNDNV